MREADKAYRSKRAPLAVQPHPPSSASHQGSTDSIQVNAGRGLMRRDFRSIEAEFSRSSAVIRVVGTPSWSEPDVAGPVLLSQSLGRGSVTTQRLLSVRSTDRCEVVQWLALGHRSGKEFVMQEGTPENSAKQVATSASRQVKLRLVERSDQPTTANFSTVAVAQGIAYLDFGFIEPALLGRIARTVTDRQSTSKIVDGHRVARLAMPLEQLIGLHQQIQQVLINMRDARSMKKDNT